MSASTAGCTPQGFGRWVERLSSSYSAGYERTIGGAYRVNVRSLEGVLPRPNLIRAELAPQPNLDLARKVARRFVEQLIEPVLA